MSTSRLVPPNSRARPQSSYIESSNGRHDAISLYRYEDIDAFVAELEVRLKRSLAWKHINASPHAAFDITQEEISEARKKLNLEYSIYNGIQTRTSRLPESASAEN
jgi:hypothetical protein